MKWWSTLLFIVAMFFLGFIILASTPSGRIQRACLPVEGGGNVLTALVTVFKRDWEDGMREGSAKVTHSCRFFIFKVFYADELERQKAAAEAANGNQQGT